MICLPLRVINQTVPLSHGKWIFVQFSYNLTKTPLCMQMSTNVINNFCDLLMKNAVLFYL